MRSLLWGSLFVLSGCNRAPECVDNGQCGRGQACVANECVDVECVNSSACSLEQYCDLTTYACKDGCELDEDCRAGEICGTQSRQCESYGCRSTELDCALGEVCTASGTCQRASGAHCQACYDPYFGSGCGSNATCYAFDEAGIESYCIVNCTSNDQCPRGYECFDVTGYGDKGCFSWCPTTNQLSQ